MESSVSNKTKTKPKLQTLGFVDFVKMLAGKIPTPLRPYAILLLHTICLVFLLYPIEADKLIINILFFMPVVGLLLAIGNFKTTCIGETVIIYILYYTNEFVTAARGQPLNFMDIYNIKEAVRVAGAYAPPVSVFIVIYTVLFIVITVINLKLLNKTEANKTVKSSVVGGAASFASICIIAVVTMFNLLKTEAGGWDEQGFFLEYGFFYGLYCQYMECRTIPPDDYTPDKMNALFATYAEKNEQAKDKIVPTNVVVVMNEAFADFDLIGETDINESPLKNWHELKDNCVKGNMYVDIFGGGTSVTEFEFLTGCAVAFTKLSTPYTQTPLKGCSSLASDLRDMGYTTNAIHPYYGKEWRRVSVYPQLGFNNMVFGENFVEGYEFKPDILHYTFPYFGDVEYYRQLVSDAECYKKISSFDKEGKDFIFCVTMQNHGGYGFDFEYDGMKEYIPADKQPEYPFWDNDYYRELISGLNQEVVPAANQYLNLTYISDEALADYLDELRNSDEPTVFVMFGDHQPALEFEWYKSKYSDNGNEYQKEADYYVVPYLMWANYDVDWEQHDKISVNYLSAVLKRSCGLPLNEWDNVRLAAMEEYPVLTSHFAINSRGEYIAPKEISDSDVMNDYYLMQFDKLEQCKHK